MFTVVVATVTVYLWVLNLQAHGRSAAAVNMPELGLTDVGKYWAFPVLQASGLSGLLFAYLSVILGLQQSGRVVSCFPLTYRQINRIHRQVSLMVIGLVLIHVVATVFDAMGNTWQSVLIPGAVASTGWPAAVWGFNTGVFAFYALLLLAPTFYVRRRIGIRRWRFLHRFVLLFYGLSVWHALIVGLDVSYYGWIRPAIWLAQVPLLALIIARIRQPARSNSEVPHQSRRVLIYVRHVIVAASCAGIAAVLIIVATGNSGFIHTV
jgi:predicted ferric reductase